MELNETVRDLLTKELKRLNTELLFIEGNRNAAVEAIEEALGR